MIRGRMMKGLLTFLHVVCVIATLLGAAGAGVQLIDTFNHAVSAPQQGAGAAMALAMCVIPYVIMRCFSTSLAAVEAADASQTREEQLAILKQLVARNQGSGL